MEYYEAAAKWWGDILRNPGDPSNYQTGKSADIEDVTNALVMTSIAVSKSVSERNILEFEELLAKKIKSMSGVYGIFSINCDYSPDNILGDIAVMTDIPRNLFPMKTRMDFKDGVVTVTKGYGASKEQIFPND